MFRVEKTATAELEFRDPWRAGHRGSWQRQLQLLLNLRHHGLAVGTEPVEPVTLTFEAGVDASNVVGLPVKPH